MAIIASLAKRGKVSLYSSAISFSTASYILAKHNANTIEEIKTAIDSFIDLCKVTVVDKKTITYAINSGFTDFEDAMQTESAIRSKCDAIITRNKKDFVLSPIIALEPSEYLQTI